MAGYCGQVKPYSFWGEKSRGNDALLSLFFAELYTSLPQHVPVLHIQGNIQGRYFNPGGPVAAVF